MARAPQTRARSPTRAICAGLRRVQRNGRIRGCFVPQNNKLQLGYTALIMRLSAKSCLKSRISHEISG